MAQKLIECVPNFSEGRDLNIIKQITTEIENTEGVKLLNVDPGNATNRTVVTMVGEPDAIVNAAFAAIKMASEVIDMSKHTGEHPRMGATDVCPFVPIANISIEETVKFSKKLAKRVGEELNIPVYLYEESAQTEQRKNLAAIRAGEYEGFADKIKQTEWKPDYGPATFNEKAGATAIGCRDFLIAYNINLNTKSVRKANSIAFDVRENGRVKRIGDPITGKIVYDKDGNEERVPGTLKGVKGIGWFIEEYNVAQVSVNITKFKETPLHVVFEECVKSATSRGIRVTGSELIGLVPLSAMVDAGKYFLEKQQLSSGVSESELIHIAIKSMGLDELGPFNPNERIIEYQLKNNQSKPLVNLKLTQFADETASESPAPGGGSISAYVGALGVSLAIMVANLSVVKRGWQDKWKEFSNHAEEGQKLKDQLINLVDEDTNAFNAIMDAFRLPKNTDAEKNERNNKIQEATKLAIEIPFKVMQVSNESMKLIKAMVEKGNPNSVTDAGVAALCARSAVIGAHLNVKINAKDCNDRAFLDEILKKAADIEANAVKSEKEILDLLSNNL